MKGSAREHCLTKDKQPWVLHLISCSDHSPCDLWIPAWIAIKGPIILLEEALMSYVWFILNKSESQAEWTSPQMKNANRCIAMSLIIAFWCCLLTLQKAHIMMLTWNPIMQMHCTAGSVWPLGYFIIQPICLTKTKTFWPKNIFYLQAVKMINGFASTGLNMKCETKQ